MTPEPETGTRPGSVDDRCRFKDLCIDVTDPQRMAAFWAPALGLKSTALDNGAFVLGDDVAEHTVWLNRVPEAKVVKQRVHLDVHAASVSDLQAVGAQQGEALPRWTLMADPEGGEFCVFVRPPDRLPTYRLMEIVVDAADPALIATWWGHRLGATPQHSEDGSFWWLDSGVGGLPVDWVFQDVPEPKTIKNRIHWDVLGEISGLIAAGASLIRARDEDIAWDVLADPEGNEFCVFPRSL